MVVSLSSVSKGLRKCYTVFIWGGGVRHLQTMNMWGKRILCHCLVSIVYFNILYGRRTFNSDIRFRSHTGSVKQQKRLSPTYDRSTEPTHGLWAHACASVWTIYICPPGSLHDRKLRNWCGENLHPRSPLPLRKQKIRNGRLFRPSEESRLCLPSRPYW